MPSQSPPENQTLRERKKSRARQQILISAEQLIRSQGYEQTTMRQIAAAAEFSYQTLYNYFPTKGDILVQMLSARLESANEGYASLLQSFESGILNTLNELVRQALTQPAGEDRALWRIAMVELLNRADGVFEFMNQISDASHQYLTELLQSAQRTGELKAAVSVPALAATLYDLIDYAVVRLLLDPTMDVEQAGKNLSVRIALVVSPYVMTEQTPS